MLTAAVPLMGVAFAGSTPPGDPWADSVITYAPVSPQPGFTDPSRALGEPAGGGMAVPNNDDVVSIGEQGGHITLAFDTPVTDDPQNPMGLDFVVHSNALWVGANPQKKFQEPAIIEISEDVNGNGIADDPWYLIPGSRGFSPSPFPFISEPAGVDNEPPHPSTLLAGTIRNPHVMDGSSANDQDEFNWGYAELTPTAEKFLDNYVRPDDPFTVGLSPRSGGGDAFDIAWAVDNTGAQAGLTQFHFIRITNFIDRTLGTLGPSSSEIAAVSDVAPDIDSDNDGILDEYETRVAGTDPNRPESTVLPLEIPSIEGGSAAGALLGVAEDVDENRIRLFSDGERASLTRSVTVDITSPSNPGGSLPEADLIASGAVRAFTASIADFTAEEIEPAEFTIVYTSLDIDGLDEPSLEPFRFDGTSFVRAGITQVNANPQGNRVTFRSQFPGTFILAAPSGSGDDQAPGPRGAIDLSATPVGQVVADPVNTVTVTSGVIVDQDDVTVADGTLITVSTSAGAITSGDASGSVAGVQVATTGGTMSFSVQAPTMAGNADFTAASVEGSAFGELTYFFAPGPAAAPVSFLPGEPQGDGPITITMTSAPVRDQYGNIVTDGTALTISADQGTIVTGDADSGEPGHQVITDGGVARFDIQLPDEQTVWNLDIFADSAMTELLGSAMFTEEDYPELPLRGVFVLAVLLIALGTWRSGRPYS